jgi:hypothetical protein
MRATCLEETTNTAWREQAAGGTGERQFKQCYPSVETETPTRHWVDATLFTDGFYRYGSDINVGLYGRYCGGGQPAGDWYQHGANKPGYQPKDPIDALCMDHDNSSSTHKIDPVNFATAACIVRYGIDTATLHEEGVIVPRNSERWHIFWNAWPEMAEARDYWLHETSKICFGPVYSSFKSDRGLS